MSRLELPHKPTRWIGALGAFAALVFFAFDMGFFAAGLLPQPKAPDEIPSVDLVVVLTGGQGRLREAVQFLQNGKGHYLLLSGTAPQASLDAILKANKIDDLSPSLLHRVFLEAASTSTQENAVEIRRVAERIDAHKLLLVTSNYHMRRAMHWLKQEFSREPAYLVHVLPYPVESPNFPYKTWWASPTGWQVLVSEYFKSMPARW